MNNCAGGTTPWGTVLSGEENFNQYFSPPAPTPTREALRPRRRRTPQLAHGRPALGRHQPDYANEPNRFGWIVEVDPENPIDPGQAHRDGPLQARGRQRHRQPRRHVVAYMGDDERFDYVYRFVSRDTYREGGSARDRAAQPDPARRGRPVRGAVHRRRPRGRRQRRHRRVDPADQRRPVDGARLHPRGGARLHPAGRRRGAADQDGPPRGRRAQPRQRPHLRRVHQQHRPRQGRQGGADRAQPAQPPTRTATSSRCADRWRPHRRRRSPGTCS